MKNKGLIIILLCWTAYLISYVGRTDYNACLVEIVNETGVARGVAGTVSSVFALCYAVGQITSAFALKRLSPVKVIGAELLTVACINLLFANTASFAFMTLLWGFNGCIQSVLLSSITAVFSQNLSAPYLARGAVALNTVGAVGGLVNYLLSWVFITFSGWRYLFASVSAALVFLFVLWSTAMPRLCQGSVIKPKKNGTEESDAPCVLISRAVPVFVVAGAFFIGSLRESVSLWIPSYVNEEFGISSGDSVIATVFVPCLQICGAFIGGWLGRRTRNLLLCSAAAFSLSGLSLAVINALGSKSLPLSVLLFAVNAVCMTAALTFLLSLFPIMYFDKKTVPVLVGIINFSVHCGDFAASFGIGWLSQTADWGAVFTALSAVAFLAATICSAGGYFLKKGRV